MAKLKNTIEIKKFNKDGLIKLRDFYVLNGAGGDFAKGNKKDEFKIPIHFLADSALTESLDTPKKIDLDKANQFTSRYELGKYFYNLLHQTLTDSELNSQGIWEWIALFYFDSMFSTSKRGWKLRRYDHYIYTPGKSERARYKMPVSVQWRENMPTGMRHCVRGPYFAYGTFKEGAELILDSSTGPAFRGQMAEEMLSRRWIQHYKIVNSCMKKVFVLPDGSLKKKWNSTSAGLPGTLRRYLAVVDSVMFEHNLYKMKDQDLIKELGKEFI